MEQSFQRDERHAAIDHAFNWAGLNLPVSRSWGKYKDLPHQETAVSALRSWLSVMGRPMKNLIIYGSVGTGKTRLLATVARQCVLRGLPSDFNETGHWWLPRWRVLFVKSQDISDRIKNSKTQYANRERPTTPEVVSHYCDPFALFIDDIDHIAGRDCDAASALCEIIFRRYDMNKPIMCTSNASPEELVGQLSRSNGPYRGDAAISRLQHAALVIKLEGPDLRYPQ